MSACSAAMAVVFPGTR